MAQRKLLGQVLKEMNLVSEYDIQQVLQEQKVKGGALGNILLEKGLAQEAWCPVPRVGNAGRRGSHRQQDHQEVS